MVRGDRVRWLDCCLHDGVDDASGSNFDVVLHQGAGPLAFFSRAIAPHHAKFAAYERELISLIKVVRHWRPWTWSFIIWTNHFSLKYLFDQRLSMIPMFGYQFSVEFKPDR
jgi:hypothetical protein